MNFSRIPRDVSRALYILIRSRLYSRAAGTRMRQHPVPSRAAWTYLRYGLFDLQSADWCCNLRLAYQTAFGLYPLFIHKESTFCFGVFFWLHQRGIPHRTCRFYCCLAAHQRTKEMDSAGVPLLYPLDSNSSPWGIRCGGAYLLPRLTGI